MQSREEYTPYALGGLCALGGVLGYARSHSVMSLVGGCGIGACYAASGYLIQNGQRDQGHLLGLGSSLMLAGLMGKRYNKTRAIVPAGALLAVGCSGTVYHGMKYNVYRRW